MDQVKFGKTALKKFEVIWSVLSKPYHFKFFKGSLPQILLGPFLNTLAHIKVPCQTSMMELFCKNS